MWLEKMREKMTSRRNLSRLRFYRNSTTEIEREIDAYTIHIPVRVNKFRDVVGSVLDDANDAVAELQEAGYTAGKWTGPTGQLFVYVEAD